ncbi:hypothetical protein PSA7680_02473 [Pseudoruegeria aquimaris]|uniref:HTH cro/C1-type domain-containing protein n=1 Tax=Pseudoruegeria aquimaris TaxID=393663 RepID=A0A1Y5SYC0_9RHOB|nr:AAA family ATPase [Pseudoruegeria aquimaris]SLN47984.1 hypothetical protein PSA7680_02473 [Pseudoruegeria aquimaris]
MTQNAQVVQMTAEPDEEYVTNRLPLRDRMRAQMNTDGLSQAAAAREIGISPSALNQWLQGKYAGNNDEVEARIENWLTARQRREAASSAMPEPPEFFRSPSAEKVVNALSYAQMAGDIVCIYGNPGVGKTKSFRHYRDTNPSVWIATMSPDSAGLVPALEEVAEAIGLRDAGGGARRIARAIRRKIEGTRGLLIIDEAQHLSTAALEELRIAIHDATGIGLVFAGNPEVYSRLTGGNRSMRFAQIFSRIGMRLFIPRPTVGDVKSLAAAWGVKGSPEIELLKEVAAEPGALRGASKVLALAAMASGGDITLAALRQARANLGGQE